jgi:hypothetical protein
MVGTVELVAQARAEYIQVEKALQELAQSLN